MFKHSRVLFSILLATATLNNFAHTWNPNFYHKHAQLQQEEAGECLQNIRLTGMESILDIGCGNGAITASLAHAVPNGSVVGIDMSPDMIAFARTTYTQQEHPNLTFKQCDACTLSLVEQFDLVTSFACLHWIEDLQTALYAIHASLKPSGTLLFRMTVGTHPTEEPLATTIALPRWKSYFKNFPSRWYFPAQQKVLEQQLKSTGFHIEHIQMRGKHAQFDSPQELSDWIATWTPHLNYIPQELHQAFLDDVVIFCLQEQKVSTNISIEKFVIEVRATKL